MFDKIKAWFKYSETIFLARLEAASGLVLAGLMATDVSTLITTGLTKTQGIVIGASMFVKGIVTELARRRNDSAMS